MTLATRQELTDAVPPLMVMLLVEAMPCSSRVEVPVGIEQMSEHVVGLPDVVMVTTPTPDKGLAVGLWSI